jgi:hydroxyacylglutathione hydrolase
MITHGPLKLAVFVEPMFQESAYLLSTTDAPEAWIIDPGLPPQERNIAAAIQQQRLDPRAILLTHCHADHIAGAGGLCRAFPELKLWAPRAEEHMLSDPVANLSAPFGFEVVTPPAETLLAPGDELMLGPLTWLAIDVAGHSPGGLAYYCPEIAVVFVGDALFAGGIGRYDFPGSSGPRLLANIRQHLLSLPPETVVYSGHGSATTIGEERDTNPFLLGDFEE